MSRYYRVQWALAAVLSAVGAPVVSQAQEEPTATGQLDEITVTARRRDESIQDVPVSIQAMSGDEMELRGIERVEDVVASAPNVMVSSGPSGQVSPTFAMRGIPRAGFFVDGVWQQTSVGLGQRGVMELDRVEVLRGPQGTLYGRDTTGGALRLYTRLPADEFGVRVTAIAGSYDRTDLTFHMDLPLAETLKSKISMYTNKRDGYVTSLITGRATGEIDDQAIRADLLWKPGDRFRARLSADRTRSRTTQPNYTLHVFDPGAPGIDPGLGFLVPPHQYYEVLGIPYNCQSNVPGCPGGRVGDLESVDNYNGGPGVMIDLDSVSLKLDYEFNDKLSLSSLTNYTDVLSWFYSNFDNTEVDYFSQGTYADRGTWSQEFQLTGSAWKLHWVSGLYGWQSDNLAHGFRWALYDFTDVNPNGRFTFAQLQASPFCAPRPGLIPCVRGGLIPQDTLTSTREEGYAAFGELTLDVTRTLAVTFGMRYHDQTNFNWSNIFLPQTPRRSHIPGHLPGGDLLLHGGKTNERQNAFDQITYRGAITNKFNEDLMAYIGFAQGYNAGGISRINIPDANGNLISTDFPFDPETVNNYEIGLRSDWLNGRLRLNATAFFTEWQDIQLAGTVRSPLTGAVLPTFLTQNAAAAEAKGAELSLVYRPVEQFLVNIDVGLLDTGYTEIASTVGQDLTKNARFGEAPEQQYSVGGQWTANLGTNEMLFRVDYNYTTGFMRTYVPGDQSTTYSGEEWEQPAYGLLAARAVFSPPDHKWELALFGTNLTDERYTTGGFMSPLLQIDDGTIARPREYGVSIKVRFE